MIQCQLAQRTNEESIAFLSSISLSPHTLRWLFNSSYSIDNDAQLLFRLYSFQDFAKNGEKGFDSTSTPSFLAILPPLLNEIRSAVEKGNISSCTSLFPLVLHLVENELMEGLDELVLTLLQHPHNICEEKAFLDRLTSSNAHFFLRIVEKATTPLSSLSVNVLVECLQRASENWRTDEGISVIHHYVFGVVCGVRHSFPLCLDARFVEEYFPALKAQHAPCSVLLDAISVWAQRGESPSPSVQVRMK